MGVGQFALVIRQSFIARRASSKEDSKGWIDSEAWVEGTGTMVMPVKEPASWEGETMKQSRRCDFRMFQNMPLVGDTEELVKNTNSEVWEESRKTSSVCPEFCWGPLEAW